MNVAEPRACDAEPIHIPGAIQPHGVLVAFGRARVILEISANCAELFGVAPDDVLGRPLEALAGTAAEELLDAVGAAHSRIGEPLRVEIHGKDLDVSIHRQQGIWILEFERHDPRGASSDRPMRAALSRLQGSNSVGELCAIAVDAVRRLTGFDRVMLYRFDDDGHGDVVDESLGSDVASYRGLRFPASDIPRQARELYLLNWLRLIPDSRYEPVPIVTERGAGPIAPLDLSFSTLRSVSPVHLEYLRNMGVGASMSISLVESNQLWGLIACHHLTPRHVSLAVRNACETIGRVVALQIGAQEELEIRAARDALRGIETRLTDALREGPDVALALVRRGDALLELVSATGAAVCADGEIHLIGVTPSPAQITGLVSWLETQGAVSLFHTESLSARHPPAAEYAHLASAVLAMTLPRGAPSYVIWFRLELVRTVSWAGDPDHHLEDTGDRASLHPRNSFGAWTEVVRGHGRRWRIAEIDAAQDLRRRAVETDLAAQVVRAEKAVRLRDDMVAVVSHDLKGPLQVIGLATTLLLPSVAGDERAKAILERVQGATGRMSALIHDLLDLAKIESGRLEVAPVPCAVSHLMRDSFALLAPLAEAKQIRLDWTGASDLWVDADPERVFQVMSNIVGNAIKFTPPSGAVHVEVQLDDRVVRFAVRDSGPGIAEDDLEHIFDRYWQTRRVRGVGSGLGLYIAKGIVEAHGQTIRAESTQGAGATFHFGLPAHAPTVPPNRVSS